MAGLVYRGTVGGLLRYGLPELRRAGMRGWTLKKDLGRIQNALAKSSQDDAMRLMDRKEKGRGLPESANPEN